MDPVFDKPLKEDSKVRYRGRNHSAMGRLSLGIGVVGWVVFLILVVESRAAQGDSMRLGTIGALDFLLGVFGLIFGGRGLRESNVFYRSALSGAVLCEGLAAALFGLYLSGTVL